MKHFLPIAGFVTLFSVYYLITEYPALPPRFQYLPDLVVGAIGAIVVVRLVATQRILSVPLKYVISFVGFTYVVVSGTVLNDVSAEVTFAGIRNYFKFVPFFLLPFAYVYSPNDVRKQLWVFLGLALLQVPISLRQRFSEYAWSLSGDIVTGTTGGSGVLSVFLVAAIVMLFAQFLGKRITLGWTLLLGLLLLLPTTINETKVTPIVLFIGGAGLLYAKRRQVNTKQIVLIGAFAIVMLSLFVGVYNTMYEGKAEQSYVQRVSENPAQLGLSGARAHIDALRSEFSEQRKMIVGRPPSLIQGSWVGRFDSMGMPFQAFLPGDILRLLFGVGIGNATSTFGNGGDYLFLSQLGSTKTTVTQLIWECGVLGVLFFLSFVALVLRDALSLSTDAEWGDLGAGWTGVTLIILLVCFYLSFFMNPILFSLFAFFSGLVAARRNALRHGP